MVRKIIVEMLAGDRDSVRAGLISQPLLASAGTRCRGASRGQSVVEAALAFTVLVGLLVGVISAGQLIDYNIGLSNAAAAAARAASIQADETNGNPTTGAVDAVNREQGVSIWSACSSPVVAPCVAVTSAVQSTGSGTSVTVEQVTLHGTFQPVVSLWGLTLPVTVTASAGT